MDKHEHFKNENAEIKVEKSYEILNQAIIDLKNLMEQRLFNYLKKLKLYKGNKEPISDSYKEEFIKLIKMIKENNKAFLENLPQVVEDIKIEEQENRKLFYILKG